MYGSYSYNDKSATTEPICLNASKNWKEAEREQKTEQPASLCTAFYFLFLKVTT